MWAWLTFQGQSHAPGVFEEGSGCADAKDATREKLSFSVMLMRQKKKELDLSQWRDSGSVVDALGHQSVTA